MDKKILRFDIETAAEVYTDEERFAYQKRYLWENKCLEKQNPTTKNFYLEHCWIYPEFSKVICISMMIGDKITSLTGEEKEILEKFNQVLEKSDWYVLGGFNIWGFDIPYLWKRMIINGVVPHRKLCTQYEKPRETTVVDVMNMRKHTSFTCSLDTLSVSLFGESPKTDMEGSNVTHAFYAGNIEMVKNYCEGGVKFTARCYEAITNPLWCRDSGLPCPPEEPSQEGMVSNPNKPEFTSIDMIEERKNAKAIIKKWETAEFYIAELENHYTIPEDWKQKIYQFYEAERKRYLDANSKSDDGFPF